jgi:hypothetical protein
MEKINIAELLKDCPKGMELDCTIWDNVTFECVDNREEFSIIIRLSDGCREAVTDYGCYSENEGAKCVIFPKGKTTWEGFQRPFKDGDIIFTHANCLKVGLGNTWISIFQEKRNGGVATYVDYAEDGGDFYSYNEDKGLLCMDEDIMRQRFATEKEKERLFQAIKVNGYKWNPETKTLEKLIQPKFNVGDRIRHKNDKTVITITGIKDNYYLIQFYNSNKNDYQNEKVSFKDQDKYELAINKFNINTLVPFESRVLVRDNVKEKWHPGIWGFYDDNSYNSYPYKLIGDISLYCIPYKGNEHLLGTTDDCDEFYKTWES